jgi:hypothetical protein
MVAVLGADADDPTLHCLGHELGAVVRPNVRGHAASDKQVGQDIDHLGRAELPRHPDSQRFAGELVDHAEHADLAAVPGTILNKIVGPNEVGSLRPQPDAGVIVEPKAAALRLPRRHLQPLLPPNALDPLVVGAPACRPQQGRDPAVAIPAIQFGKADDLVAQRRFVVRPARRLALRRAVLTQHLAGKPFRDPQPGRDMLDAGPTTGSAQKFRDAASFRMTFSSARSATAFRSRPFSVSSCFRRFIWSSFNPPYSDRQR